MKRQDIINQIFDNQSIMKRGMQHYFNDQMNTLPLSRAQLELLFAIKQHQPVPGKQLAQNLSMTAGAVSQLLDGLLTHNFVARTADSRDRRLQLLQLSKKGDKFITTVESRRQKVMEKVINELETDELVIWLRVQNKMIAQLESYLVIQKGIS